MIDGKEMVIIGVGQVVNRYWQTGETKDVVELISSAVQKAEQDAGCRELISRVDTLMMVNSFSITTEDPFAELITKLAMNPRHRFYTWIGATAPQWYVNWMKKRLAAGESRLGLICGGEALYSRKIQIKTGVLQGMEQMLQQKKPWMAGDLRDPLTEEEMKYGLMLPVHVYPLFENAMRKNEGLSPSAHFRELGEFCAALSKIAASNDYAWYPRERSAVEILDCSGDNRIVSWPYTKYMCSIMDVDQAAALLVTNEAYANELGIPRDKRIYLLGSGDSSDIWHFSEREQFYASPSVWVAAKAAMQEAGIDLPDIDIFDFYSCFPSAIRMTRNMLGLSRDDPRPLTITGGMAAFGGPGNNYSLHAICSMVEHLRKHPNQLGMVQALSWFISKHSVGIYSGENRASSGTAVLPDFYTKQLKKLQPVQVITEASGPAMVETYSLFHDRQGTPVGGVIIGKTNDGRRFLAKADMAYQDLEKLMYTECIGMRGRVFSKEGVNYFRFD